MKIPFAWWVVLLGLSAGACERGAKAPPEAAKVGVAKDVVATVNGVPITRFEVLLRVRTQGKPAEGSAEAKQRALDAIVTEELFAQRASALGLESDLSFQEEMARVQAQVAEVRRRELSKLFLHKEIIDKAEVTAAEVKAHMAAHPSRFNSELHLSQLVQKGRPAIDAMKAELDQGRSFDEVAAEKIPVTEPGTKPWELPPMRWEQVPASWWPAIDVLEVGSVSPPFHAGNDRWVMLKLRERRPIEGDPIERLEPLLKTQLRAEHIEAQQRAAEASLRAVARVELLRAQEAQKPDSQQ